MGIKVCSVCKREKPERAFTTGKGCQCKTCKASKRKARLKQWLYEYKESLPCADCNNFFPHYVMEFDHREGKLLSLSTAISRTGWGKGRLTKEIAKCDLVCSNCHAIRTHNNPNNQDTSNRQRKEYLRQHRKTRRANAVTERSAQEASDVS